MKIILALKETIYDCKIKITDSQGERYYYLSLLCEEGLNTSSVIAEVFDNDFTLSVIPVMPDTKSALNQVEAINWKEKLAKKAANLVINAIDKMILRVGCDYHIVGIQEFDHLDIRLQNYAFGTFDRFELFGLLPMLYMFFEVSNFNALYKLTNAYETNRKEVIKFAKKLALGSSLGWEILLAPFIYPIQIGRIKRLTKNRKIRKVLTKFNNLNATKRQRLLKKMEKFVDR